MGRLAAAGSQEDVSRAQHCAPQRGFFTHRGRAKPFEAFPKLALILQQHFSIRGRLRQYERSRMPAVCDQQGSTNTEVPL
jgi:hypothetical protein